MVDTGGGLLRHTVAALEQLGLFCVNKSSQITTVVKDKIEGLAGGEGADGLLDAPVVLLFRFALPGKDRHTCSSDSGGGVVLCGEDVAGGPGDFGTQRCEGFDQNGGLDGCVGALATLCLCRCGGW